MEVDDIYRLAFERILQKYGYDEGDEFIDEIFRMCKDIEFEDYDWEEFAMFALDVIAETLDFANK